MPKFTIFEYLYRDASNYKAWGSILLKGVANDSDVQSIKSKLESEEFFIAEQLGIPALYTELWSLSGGPTEHDHVWHTFHALRAATLEDEKGESFGSVNELIAKIESVEEWKLELSPHWEI